MTITGRVDISAQKSTNYLIMGWWSNTTSYKLSDAGVPVVKVADGTQLGYSVYALTAESSTVGASPAGSGSSQWKLIESAEFIYMQEAYIERLQAVLVTAEKIESMMIRTKNIEILEGAIIRGTLEGVSGSFKRLNCVDNDGNIMGAIRFGNNGEIWFENCSIRHQAASGPFYTSDVWIRGVLGSYGRTAMVVTAARTGNVYAKGLSEGVYGYVNFDQKTSAQGVTYYDVPLYSPTSNTSGMPVDLIIVNHGSTARYNLAHMPGKTVTLINTNDQNSNVYVYSNGKEIQVQGGAGLTMSCVGGNQSPDSSSWLGRGWLVTGKYDNQWT